MPSKRPPGGRGSIPDWRQEMKADIGEDPGRFLDRDLLTRPGQDADVSPGAALVRARIRGIDRLERIAAWRKVEHRLDRGPRKGVLDLLDEREEAVREEGERDLPGLTPRQRRQAAAAVAPDDPPEPTWTDREGGTRTSTRSRPRTFGGPDDAGDADAGAEEGTA